MSEHVPFVQSSKITDIWSVCLFGRSSWVWYFRPCCIIRGRWRARVTGFKGQSEDRLYRGIIASANQLLEWRRALGVATRDFQAPLFTTGADGALWNKSTFSNLMLPRERRRICSCATAMYLGWHHSDATMLSSARVKILQWMESHPSCRTLLRLLGISQNARVS